MKPGSGPSGTEFLIGAAGFRPGSGVALHVYRADPDNPQVHFFETYQIYEGEYNYITSIEIATGEDGRGSFGIATVPGDSGGGYGLINKPPSQDSGIVWYEFDALFNVEPLG